MTTGNCRAAQRAPLTALILAAVPLCGSARAQTPASPTVPPGPPAPRRSPAQSNGDFDAQISQGNAALQSGRADAALSAGDAAVRIAPDRWEGYALSGRALLALKRYEMAADALSRAIERAPAAEQPALRALRRDCLLAEAGAPTSVPAGPRVASAPQRTPVSHACRACRPSRGSRAARAARACPGSHTGTCTGTCTGTSS